LHRELEDRFGVRVVDVAHEGSSASPLLSTSAVRRPPASDRTPAAKGAHQLSDVPGQPLARGAEPRAPPALDPAVSIHEAAQDIEAGFAGGIQVDVRDELLIAAESPETEPPDRFRESVRRDALGTPAVRPRRRAETP